MISDESVALYVLGVFFLYYYYYFKQMYKSVRKKYVNGRKKSRNHTVLCLFKKIFCVYKYYLGTAEIDLVD